MRIAIRRIPDVAIPRIGALLRRIRPVRRFIQAWERLPPFLAVVFSPEGLGSPVGRRLIRGKFRRLAQSFFPSYAKKLQKKHGLVGGCINCGTSCNLMFQCPHWDSKSRLCTVYEDRPSICRTFPITPADIEDRNLMAGQTGCGFTVQKP